MRIFLATPLFCEAEREFNTMVAKKLRAGGFEVWLAQESPFIKKSTSKEKMRIYRGDMSALKDSDVVVAVLDGADVDAGVAYEMGIAKASGKPLIGLKTDYRTFSQMEAVNLMLEVPLVKLCRSVDEVVDLLKRMKERQ